MAAIIPHPQPSLAAPFPNEPHPPPLSPSLRAPLPPAPALRHPHPRPPARAADVAHPSRPRHRLRPPIRLPSPLRSRRPRPPCRLSPLLPDRPPLHLRPAEALDRTHAPWRIRHPLARPLPLVCQVIRHHLRPLQVHPRHRRRSPAVPLSRRHRLDGSLPRPQPRVAYLLRQGPHPSPFPVASMPAISPPRSSRTSIPWSTSSAPPASR